MCEAEMKDCTTNDQNDGKQMKNESGVNKKIEYNELTWKYVQVPLGTAKFCEVPSARYH